MSDHVAQLLCSDWPAEVPLLRDWWIPADDSVNTAPDCTKCTNCENNAKRLP